jgi:hypothetical protein
MTVMSDGEGPMPAAWWRLADTMPLTVRHRGSSIPGLQELAFADQFTDSLSVYGPRYVDLRSLTRFDARTSRPGHGRGVHTALAAALPGTFTTVIGRHGPDAVWLALRIDRLTDQIADTLLHHLHHTGPETP